MSDELLVGRRGTYLTIDQPVVKRILGLLRPHWKWVVGFMVAIMNSSTIGRLLHLSEQTDRDEAIANQDKSALMQIALVYGSAPNFSGWVCLHIHLPGRYSVSGSNMICARRCSTTCRTFRSRITRRMRLDALLCGHFYIGQHMTC